MTRLTLAACLAFAASTAAAQCPTCPGGTCAVGPRVQLNPGPVRSVLKAAPVRKAGAAVVVGTAKVGKAAIVLPARAARTTACYLRERKPVRRVLSSPFRAVARLRFVPQRRCR